MQPIAFDSKDQGPLGTDGLRTALLSGVAGYVDMTGFLTLFGFLPAHLTAELIKTTALTTHAPTVGLGPRLALVPLFMCAVAGTALVARSLGKRGYPMLTTLLGLMALGLSVFCTSGVLLHSRLVAPEAWPVLVLGAIGVMTMGIQNAIMRLALGSLCPTTVMTGNLTQFTIHLVEVVALRVEANRSARAEQTKEALARLTRAALPLTGFLVGAGIGGWLTRDFGLISLALPTFVVAGMTLISWREDLARRAPAAQKPTSISSTLAGLDLRGAGGGGAVRRGGARRGALVPALGFSRLTASDATCVPESALAVSSALAGRVPELRAGSKVRAC